MPHNSLAGSWGNERLREMKGSDVISYFNTTYREHFNVKNIADYKTNNSHSLSKYKTMKESDSICLNYGLDQQNKDDMARTESSDKITLDKGNSSLGKYIDMKRTMSKLMSTENAPVAIGRSGARVEKGVAASGMCGEKLNLGHDISRNTLVQKSWLYNDDPALQYKLNGVPTASIPTYMSLPIGEGQSSTKVKSGWCHGRKNSSITDIMSKTSNAGVFADYPN